MELLQRQVKQACKRAKYLAEPANWVEKPKRSDTLIASLTLLDSNKQTIPKLKIELEHRVGKRTNVEVFYYKLLFQIDERWHRIIAIDVHENFQVSHRFRDGRPPIMGPHIHFADGLPFSQTKSIIGGKPETNNGKFYRRFLRHTHLLVAGHIDLSSPYPDDLFTQELP